jgi:hypothetical protein
MAQKQPFSTGSIYAPSQPIMSCIAYIHCRKAFLNEWFLINVAAMKWNGIEGSTHSSSTVQCIDLNSAALHARLLFTKARIHPAPNASGS